MMLSRRSASKSPALTGLLDLTDRSVDTLSGGQRQRAWIAMALAQETNILLLDEPTTYLDLAHQLEVLDLLCQLNEEGKTIVMVLHDLNHAASYADHLIALSDGKIVAQGTPHEVITEKIVLDVFHVESYITLHPLTGQTLCLPLCRRYLQG